MTKLDCPTLGRHKVREVFKYIISVSTLNNSYLEQRSSYISYLKQRGIRIIPIKSLKSKNDFINFFKILKNYSYNRILIEAGLTFVNYLVIIEWIFFILKIKNKIIFLIIHNIFVVINL